MADFDDDVYAREQEAMDSTLLKGLHKVLPPTLTLTLTLTHFWGCPLSSLQHGGVCVFICARTLLALLLSLTGTLSYRSLSPRLSP